MANNVEMQFRIKVWHLLIICHLVNYKVLSDIFVEMDLVTYSVITCLCDVSFVSCAHFEPFFNKRKSRSLCNAQTLKLNISKLFRMQTEPYNSKAVN